MLGIPTGESTWWETPAEEDAIKINLGDFMLFNLLNCLQYFESSVSVRDFYVHLGDGDTPKFVLTS